MFAVLECVIDLRRPVSLAEIGDHLSLPPPTAHRLATQLIDRGYLKRALGSKLLLPGPRLALFGAKAAAAAFLSDRPHALLVSLSEELNEHCQIGVMSENRIIYVDSAAAPRTRGLQFSTGASAPLHCTSTGKVHLAAMSVSELDGLMKILKLEQFTESTIVNPERLLAEIETVRQTGWATTNMEYSQGVVGCAVPIMNDQRRIIAALGASVPYSHAAFRNLSEMIPALQAAAQQIALAIAA